MARNKDRTSMVARATPPATATQQQDPSMDAPQDQQADQPTDSTAHGSEQTPLMPGAERSYAYVQIGQGEVLLSEFTGLAQQASGLSVADWNAATDEVRDQWIDSMIDNERKLVADGQAPNVHVQPIPPVAPTGTAEAATTALELSTANVASLTTSPPAELPAKVDLTAPAGRGQTPSLQVIDEAAFFRQAPAPTPAPTQAPAPAVSSGTPDTPANLSLLARSLCDVVVSYIAAVPPRTPIDPATLVQQQVYLYRAIAGMINKLEGEEFTQVWSWLLACFNVHRHGVFGERHVFRAMEEITLSPDDRKAFQRLLNLLILTCEATSRAYALRQIDMTKTLALGLTEPGRQRIHGFYGS